MLITKCQSTRSHRRLRNPQFRLLALGRSKTVSQIEKRKARHQISAREAHAHWGGMASNDVASDDLRTKEQKPAACRRAEVHEPPAVYDGCWMFEDDDEEELDEGDHAARARSRNFAPWGPVWKSNFTARSSRRPPRHRRDACSMAWRCWFLTARRGQHGASLPRNDLGKIIGTRHGWGADFHTGRAGPARQVLDGLQRHSRR